MKYFMLTGLVLFLFTMSTSCQTMAPKEVSDSFKQKYPEATDVEWEKEGDEWDVEFMLGEDEYEAVFTEAGEWIETEMEVEHADVPAEVFKTLHLNYDEFEIEEIEWMDSPDFKGYEVEVEIEEGEEDVLWEVYILEDGTFVKAEKEEEDEEDEDEDEEEEEEEEK